VNDNVVSADIERFYVFTKIYLGKVGPADVPRTVDIGAIIIFADPLEQFSPYAIVRSDMEYRHIRRNLKRIKVQTHITMPLQALARGASRQDAAFEISESLAATNVAFEQRTMLSNKFTTPMQFSRKRILLLRRQQTIDFRRLTPTTGRL
jgi:hypothetical protein